MFSGGRIGSRDHLAISTDKEIQLGFSKEAVNIVQKCHRKEPKSPHPIPVVRISVTLCPVCCKSTSQDPDQQEAGQEASPKWFIFASVHSERTRTLYAETSITTTLCYYNALKFKRKKSTFNNLPHLMVIISLCHSKDGL